jgi:hypothetical protein
VRQYVALAISAVLTNGVRSIKQVWLRRVVMTSSEHLASCLQNMVTNTLSDRVICDMSALRLMALEQELELHRIRADKLESKLKEVQ